MPETSVHSLTPDLLARFYDERTLARGAAYAKQGRVHLLRCEPGEAEGLVVGNGTAPYHVSVEWSVKGPLLTLLDDCSCPMEYECKHAVALILTCQAANRATPHSRPGPNWRTVLDGFADQNEVAATLVPLALEVGISTPKASRYNPSPTAEITLRPLRMGAKGKWIRTGVSWRDLDAAYDYALQGVDPNHRDALRTLVSSLSSNRYTLPPVLALANAKPSAWSNLRKAVDAGVELVGERGQTEVALSPEPARLAIDLADDGAGDGTILVSARLEHDDETLSRPESRVGVLGSPPHGMFVLNGTQLTLVPIAGRLPRAAGRLLTESVLVPAGDADELLDTYVPLFSQYGRVGSSDGSVEVVLNEFEGVVALVRRVSLDVAELVWGVRYRRGERITTHLLTQPVRAGRDREAELDALGKLELPTDLLADLVGPTGAPQSVFVDGQDTITLMTEVVPWLVERGQVIVEIDTDQPDLREAAGDPLIALGVSDPEPTDDGRPTDWFDLSVHVTVDGEDIEFAALFAALTRGDDVMFLPSGTWLRLDRPEFTRLRELIDEASGLADRQVEDGLRINRFQSSWWDELSKLGVVESQSERWQASVAQVGSLTAPSRVEPPAELQAKLRDYQRDGLDWLAFLVEHSLGGVLADDMGLGKTVQVLALMLHVLETKPDARFLVVAPTSVVENWHREAGHFAPTIEVQTITETAKRRGADLAETVGSAHLVVTSYALLRLEFDDYQSLGWDVMVLDEAQFAKNHRGKTYQCARRLDAATKIAVTGTPLENSLMDLWALLSITAPGLYPDPKRFSEVYRTPIESGRSPELLATLRRRIAPLMRRRTKDEVLAELPPKTELVVDVAMSPKHARIYQTQLQRERQKVLGLVGDVQRNRFEIFKSLTMLRQLSLDPGLVDDAHAAVGSAKLDRLVDDLEQVVAEGHRALVFSQFTRYLARLKTRLDEAGIGYAYLDGRTRKRDEAISRFKDGAAPVFVISLKAGGFGLNLTEADYCFVLDPWWNPAVEMQAVDRAHRMGQENPVMVYRYVSTDTIEEKVMELKEGKAALFSDVMDADGALSGALSADDIRGLFE